MAAAGPCLFPSQRLLSVHGHIGLVFKVSRLFYLFCLVAQNIYNSRWTVVILLNVISMLCSAFSVVIDVPINLLSLQRN